MIKNQSSNYKFTISNVIGEEKAISVLDSEELVILPTETVYGLAGIGYSHHAVKKIFDTKKRPYKNPLILHYSSIEQIEQDAFFNDIAKKLAQAFWPGPLTIVLNKKRSSKVSSLTCANKNKIAVRIPSHPKTINIIKKLQRPLAMPSANFYQRISTTNVSDAINGLRSIPGVEGGYCNYGLESTIVDCTLKIPTILRFGSITPDMISKVLEIDISSQLLDTNMPGSHRRHYSTRKNIRLNVEELQEGEGLIAFGPTDLSSEFFINLSETSNLEEAARKLFYSLQKMDKHRCTSIAIVPIPMEGVGIAINDRIKRASYKNDVKNENWHKNSKNYKNINDLNQNLKPNFVDKDYIQVDDTE